MGFVCFVGLCGWMVVCGVVVKWMGIVVEFVRLKLW